MNAIFNALAHGYTARTILNKIARSSPKYADAINKAQIAGYASHTILRNLTGGKSKDEDSYLTEHERTGKRDKEQKRKAAVGLASTLGTAGAIGAGLYSYLNQGKPQNLGTISGQIIDPRKGKPTQGIIPFNDKKQVTDQREVQLGGIPTSVIEAGYEKRLPTVSPEREKLLNKFRNLPDRDVIQPTKPEYKGKIEQHFPHLMLFVRKSLQNGKSPEEVEEHLRKSPLYRSLVEKVEEEEGIPFLSKIKEIQGSRLEAQEMNQSMNQRIQPSIQEEPPMNQVQKQEESMELPSDSMKEDMMPPIQDQMQIPLEEETSGIPKEIEREPISKGSSVITPSGAGEVHNIHGKNAFVKEDGKLKKVPLDELQDPDESALETVQRILNIPEEDRSSNISLFLWDPEDNTMTFQFHSGDSYKYKDVDPNIVKELAEKNATPITEGKNMYGEWSQKDRQSLGAAFYQMVLKDPKYKKNVKGQPTNPYYRKLDTMYDYWKMLRNPPKRRR